MSTQTTKKTGEQPTKEKSGENQGNSSTTGKAQGTQPKSKVASGGIQKETVKAEEPKEVIVKEIVYLRRGLSGAGLPGSDPSYDKKFLGAGRKGRSVLRALTEAEEKKYLPNILGVSATNPKFGDACFDYWVNIRIAIPPGDGKKLDISMRYPSKEAANADKNNLEKTGGEPLNVEDYIVYRHALKHGVVANDYKDVGKSPKILYYLHSERRQITAESNHIKLKREANTLYLEMINDTDAIKNILAANDVFLQSTGNAELDNEKLDIAIDELVTEQPAKFIELAKNPNIQIKAFIKNAINFNTGLRLITGTTVYMFNDQRIATNEKEMIDFFREGRNEEIKSQIEARLNAKMK